MKGRYTAFFTIFTLFGALNLSACGGGGSDTNPPPSSNSNSSTSSSSSSASSSGSVDSSPFTISFEQVTFRQDFVFPISDSDEEPEETDETEETQHQTLTITADISGDKPEHPIYIYVDYPTHIFEELPSKTTTSSIIFDLVPHEYLWNGVYSGNIGIYVCADSACNNPLSNSPYSVPYEINYRTHQANAKVMPHSAVEALSNRSYAITTQQSISYDAVDVLVHVPSNFNNFTLSEQNISAYNIVNISETGFSFSIPSNSAGSHRFNIPISFNGNDSDETVTLSFSHLVLPAEFDHSVLQFVGEERVLEYFEDYIDSIPSTVPIVFNIPPKLDGEITIDDDTINCLSWTRLTQPNEGRLISGINYLYAHLLPDVTTTNETCEINLYVDDEIVDTFTLVLNIAKGFPDAAAIFTYKEFSTSLTPHTVTIIDNPELLNSGFSWHIESASEWLIIDDAFFNPGNTALSFDIAVNFDYVSTLPVYDFQQGFIRIVDDSGQLAAKDMIAQITTNYARITSLSSTKFTVGNPINVEASGLNLSFTNIVVIRKAGNEDGLEGLLDTTVALSGTTPTSTTLSIPAINTAGDYELFVLTATESQSDLELMLSAPIAFSVVARPEKIQNQLQFIIAPKQ